MSAERTDGGAAQRKRSERGRKTPDAGNSEQIVDLDREREECMRRNQQRLMELGLLPALESLRACAASNAEAKQAASKKRRLNEEENRTADGEERVLRRSLRTKGQDPDLPALLVPLFKRYPFASSNCVGYDLLPM
ncbi:hypothetical protein Agub_g10079 [Astrephomene gubernaculifera]|uniref:Uncharacterized protein n=1 Tax=Astrephomene gubernaculifera TaxID=47775 RepID=A0AAD3DW94_9CHLO|nr:hypothetical protein Agub_g10079 [Astrephomene gubernaculifera]